jgi:steroid Delta-isomerase
MSSPEENANTVNRYLALLSKGQPDDIAELYAADATVEDPVGGEVHIGRQAIRGFYTSVENLNAETEVETLRTLGNEAAFYWYLMFSGMRISIVSVMTFNDDGKIASMKAYWGQDNIAKT